MQNQQLMCHVLKSDYDAIKHFLATLEGDHSMFLYIYIFCFVFLFFLFFAPLILYL